MKKILFVINTMGRAGAERALISLLKQLSPQEYDISLLALINRGELFEEVPDYVHLLNVRPDTRSVLSPGGKCKVVLTVLGCFFRRFSGFTRLPQILQILAEQRKQHRLLPDKLLWPVLAYGTPVPKKQYDLAVAYLEGASTYYVANRVNALKKAVFLHVDYQYAGYSPVADAQSYDRADAVFTVSEDVRKSFLQVYPQHKQKTFLFRNIIDREEICRLAQQPSEELLEELEAKSPRTAREARRFFQCSSTRLLTVGRLHPQKGYDIAVRALRKIRDAGYQVEWFILGEGSEYNRLLEQIQKEGLTDTFHLCGAVPNPYPFYRDADLYLHCTRFEGKSIAIEEAQVLGKAIIASDCPGNREQIEHEVSGLLVPMEPQQIADAVIRLLSPDALHPNRERLKYEEASRQKTLSHPEDRERFLQLL